MEYQYAEIIALFFVFYYHQFFTKRNFFALHVEDNLINEKKPRKLTPGEREENWRPLKWTIFVRKSYFRLAMLTRRFNMRAGMQSKAWCSLFPPSFLDGRGEKKARIRLKDERGR